MGSNYLNVHELNRLQGILHKLNDVADPAGGSPLVLGTMDVFDSDGDLSGRIGYNSGEGAYVFYPVA